jgi:hypothetical protein
MIKEQTYFQMAMFIQEITHTVNLKAKEFTNGKTEAFIKGSSKKV